MIKTSLNFVGVGLISLALSGTASAQEIATLVLQNGERPSGELVDLNGSGFTLRISGQDRQFAKGDVKAVEFVGGAPSADAQARVNAGQSVVILRNGQVVEGSLSDIGGARPLRLQFDTAGGPREFSSNDVAQVYLGGGAPQPVGSSGQAPAAATAPAAGAIAVQGSQAWTDTGITVARGERVQFNASGTILIGNGQSADINGNQAATVATSRYPVANAPAGSLIARVGNGAPFHVGGNTQPIVMQANGRLQLGVNDDHVLDNTGAFSVTVTRLGR